jgi:hypothetical protein
MENLVKLKKKKPSSVSIYGLVNPKNNRVFYVGATSKPVEIRLKEHLMLLNNKKPFSTRGHTNFLFLRQSLLLELNAQGFTFKIKVLEVCKFSKAGICEKKWVDFYFSKNFNLLQKRLISNECYNNGVSYYYY